MAKYLLNVDYCFIYNNETYANSDENIVVESNAKPTNPVDIHKALAKINDISWVNWGKVNISYVDINNVTEIDVINLEIPPAQITDVEGEYEIRLAWSFNANDKELLIDEFYDNASETGDVCSLPNFVNAIFNFPHALFRFALVDRRSTHIVEIPADSYLKVYTGVVTNNIESNKAIIPRENIQELLSFLTDKGLIKLNNPHLNIDDVMDEFEDLEG